MPESPLLRSGDSRHFRHFRLDCAQLSAPGRGRPVSEDRCVFAAPGVDEVERAAAGYLFAVIDGEAGDGLGRRSANETASSILEILEDERREALRPDLLSLRLHDANDRVSRFIRGKCAVSAIWMWESEDGGCIEASWSHVGDTRIYHQTSRDWRQLTRDHAKGRLLDRAIGGGPGLQIDTGRLSMRPGERLILISEGVWNGATPNGALAGKRDPTTAETVRQLVGQARLNGSRQDTSAIAIAVRDRAEPPEPEH